MNYGSVEQSIKDRLQAPLAAAGILVDVLPNTQADYRTPQGPFVWVNYERSRFDQTSDDPKHQSTGPSMQKEVLNFNITLNARTLRGNGGIFAMAQLVRSLLYGFQPANCHKLYMVEVSPEKFEENLWTYKMVMACQSVVMEAGDDETELLITQIKLDNTNTTEEIIIP